MQAAKLGDSEPVPRTVSIHELKAEADEIVREVSETGRPVDIIVHGKAVARLSPTPENGNSPVEDRREAMRKWLQETEAFAQEVARRWPSTVSSVDLVREQRREL